MPSEQPGEIPTDFALSCPDVLSILYDPQHQHFDAV
jgi:hypothetical protein